MVPLTSTQDDPAPGSSRQGLDDLFALVAGLYAALVVAPIAVGLATPVLRSAGTQYVALLAGLAAVTVAVALGARRLAGLPERLGAGRGRWLLGGTPVALAGGALLGERVAPGAVPDGVTLFALLTAVAGGFGGLILAMMAHTRYVRAVLETAETEASFRTGWPPGRRRLAYVLGAGLIVGGVVGFLAAFAFHVRAGEIPARLLVPLGVIVASFGQEREYRITTAGIERKVPVNRRLFPWAAFAGYEVSEDAVAVRFRAPWRLPLYWDRSDIDDAAALDALRRHLDGR